MKLLKAIFIISLVFLVVITIAGSVKVFDGSILEGGKWIYRATLIDVMVFITSAIALSVFHDSDDSKFYDEGH